MKRILTITTLILLAAILAAGCMSAQKTATPASAADDLFAKAGTEFQNANYRAATTLYTLAQENYTAAGNTAAALKARDKASRSLRMFVEFPYNRSAEEQAIATTYPDVPADRRAGWLAGSGIATIKSDGEVLYFSENVGNIGFHNPDLMQKQTAVMNRTPLYDSLTSYTFAPQNATIEPYGEPVAWDGTEMLSIPREALPKTGTFRLWIPLPVESGSQTNVTIVSVEPARYVKSSTGTGSDLDLAYLEIPLETFNDPFLNVTARFRFVQHEQRFVIDTAKVKPYNTSDPGYIKYTTPGRNIVITPEMKKKAQDIVGNESNPYLQAQKIYWHIMDTLPYSHTPHFWLEAAGIPESSYVLDTGIGDCGSQSMYFAALCRSLGIPARAVGGYQLIPGGEGTHFWAEYYLEGYGWIPVDVTAAETADWSYNATLEERHRFKEYYFGSLDPYRYIIQNDVDIPLTPDPGDAVMFRMVVQNPKAVCDTCDADPEIDLLNNWIVTVKKV
jgi:transglutaminase-like putative cysteine protease